MKLLWVKTNLLHPLNSGGTIRTYQMLRHLKRDHELTYVTLQSEDATAVDQANEYCDRLIQVPWRGAPRRSQPRFYAQALRNLSSSLPLALARYHVPALRERLTELAAASDFDVVVSDFLFPALHFDALEDESTILFQHNVEALIWKRMAERSRGLKRRYFGVQARRMRNWEGRLAGLFDHVVTVSADDAELMRDWYGVDNVTPVPTGVDTEYFHPNEGEPDSRIVFVGSLDWLPNIDAVEWTLDEIWPRIRALRPGAQLEIVGRSPSLALRRRVEGLTDVRLAANVPDVRHYLWNAAVVLVPLRVGGGTRLKIFEALSSGKAVVSTPVGAEGLPVSDGEHLLLRSDPAGIAGATVDLLDNPNRRQHLERSGRALVEREFGWQRAADAFSRVCASLAEGRAMGVG